MILKAGVQEITVCFDTETKMCFQPKETLSRKQWLKKTWKPCFLMS